MSFRQILQRIRNKADDLDLRLVSVSVAAVILAAFGGWLWFVPIAILAVVVLTIAHAAVAGAPHC